MTKTISIEVRSVYGENKAYPLCQDAKLFASIAGTKTITCSTLLRVLALGYQVEARASCPGFTAAVVVTKASDLPAVQ